MSYDGILCQVDSCFSWREDCGQVFRVIFRMCSYDSLNKIGEKTEYVKE